MTRRLPVVHAVPLLIGGQHKASPTCPCAPIEASDLLQPSTRVLIHRDVPDVRDARPVRVEVNL